MAPTRPATDGDDMSTALHDSLQPANRHVFLEPPESLPVESLAVIKKTLDEFAAHIGQQQEERLKENRKRKRREGGGDGGGAVNVLKLRKVYVDGFETGQVWQQAKRIIAGVLDYSETVLRELEEAQRVTLPDADSSDGASDEGQEMPEVSSEGDADEQDDDQELSVDEEEQDSEHDLEDGDEDDEIVDEDRAEAEEEDEEEDEEFVQDAHGLNDGFFSIDKFNRQTQWFEEQDARGDPTTDQASDDEDIDWAADPLAPPKAPKGKQRPSSADDAPSDEDEDEDDETGPTFGDMSLDAPEGDSDDDAMMDDADEDADETNANEIFYKDFFAPPPRKNTGGKPKKSVKFKAQEPAPEEEMERAMADVRRDLFDDESDDESDDGLSDVSAGDPKSRRSAHERRQAKLADEIRRLEAASVAKREWTLSGEATAVDRPMNSLLEQDLDFEHVGKPVPVITPEVSESIEELIKRRILAQEFDEVLRRRPDAEGLPAGTRRGLVELDDSKSAKGLAELYEEEHVKQANPDSYVSAADDKTQREEKEVEAMWRDVCARLDALSSWHYKPKPAAPTLSVVADVATVAMEDAQPATAQGVYRAGAEPSAAKGEVVTRGGVPLARDEMSREDRVRRRRRTKERARKAEDGQQQRAGGKNRGNSKAESAGAKMRRETVAELKRGGVKVINRKGEVTDVEGNKAKAAKALTSGGLKL
ncbi:hypothetical protein HIM_08128 [Hirsutella minnesotensis 3608]|uniref:U3 small nucleolar ribonucleoprotein protein MPP10 n=1 Tax=Hirsutella minnesotensis 3608 TaxID=1043627 RepID=A0A0F8A3U9_9HYPO|nr:hypothetical protein HIM_08128 [Hirsutella minnesotensis 3608]